MLPTVHSPANTCVAPLYRIISRSARVQSPGGPPPGPETAHTHPREGGVLGGPAALPWLQTQSKCASNETTVFLIMQGAYILNLGHRGHHPGGLEALGTRQPECAHTRCHTLGDPLGHCRQLP